MSHRRGFIPGTAAAAAAVMGLLAVFGTASSALSANLPIPGTIPTYLKGPQPPAPPPAAWSGIYVGGDVGYGSAKSIDNTMTDPNDVAFNTCGPCFGSFSAAGVKMSNSDLIGGGHLGYNWQMASSWLAGLEGEFDGTRIKLTGNAPVTSVDFNGNTISVPVANQSFQTNLKWLASARARAGYVQDNWLIYATGGVAWANADFHATASCPADPVYCSGRGSDGDGGIISTSSLNSTRTGWVAGGGLEFQAPASAWRARVEYLYYGFDGATVQSAPWQYTPTGTYSIDCQLTPGPCAAKFSSGNLALQTIRVGLSYALR